MPFSKDYDARIVAEFRKEEGYYDPSMHPLTLDIIVAQLDRVIELLEQQITNVTAQAETLSIDVQAMIARADSNRDNAHTLFGDVLYNGCYLGPDCFGKIHDEDHPQAWRRRDNRKRVVFTPYGWVDEPE